MEREERDRVFSGPHALGNLERQQSQLRDDVIPDISSEGVYTAPKSIGNVTTVTVAATPQ